MTPSSTSTGDTTRVLQTSTFAFAILGVPDVARAVDFYTRGASLTALDVGDDEAGLATLDGRASLILRHEAAAGLQLLAYAVADSDDLAAFEQKLEAAGVTTMRDPSLPHCTDAVRFNDPDDYHIALVVLEAPSAIEGGRLIEVDEILHPLLKVRDVKRSVAFYSSVLGFETSDMIADVTAFMRCADQFHHSLAITDGKGDYTVDHLCFHLPAIDALMRSRNRLRHEVGAECTEAYRHGGSESITFYFQDPWSGVQIEYCAYHRKITTSHHEPRILPAAPTTFDRWALFGDTAHLAL